jgi:hypothetical protein
LAQNVNPTFVKTPNRGVLQVSTGTGTSITTLYTGGVSGSKVVSISGYQNSTATISFNAFYVTGGVSYIFNTVSLAAATFAQVMPTTNAVDSDGNPYLILASTADAIAIQATTTLPSAGSIAHFIATGSDF